MRTNRRPMSYEEELNEFLDEQDQFASRFFVEQFVEAGKRVGIDVVAEILDHGKSAGQVFQAIRAEQ